MPKVKLANKLLNQTGGCCAGFFVCALKKCFLIHKFFVSLRPLVSMALYGFIFKLMDILGFSSSQCSTGFTIYKTIVTEMPLPSWTLKVRIITPSMPNFPVSLMYGFLSFLAMTAKRNRHKRPPYYQPINPTAN